MEEKILFLGLPRSGTFSLTEALRQLGYKPFHGSIGRDRPDMFVSLNQAFEAKFNGKGKKWEAEEWRRFLAGYDPPPPAVHLHDEEVNFFYITPAYYITQCILMDALTYFVDDLITAFPTAPIVVLRRDFPSWYRSMQETVLRNDSWRSWPLVMWSSPFINGMMTYSRNTIRTMDMQNPEAAEKYYQRWNEQLRSIIDEKKKNGGQVLEYKVREGWAPLCDFLGVQVPKDKAFPRANDSRELRRNLVILWWMAVVLAVLKVAGAMLPVVAAVFAVRYYRGP